MKNVGQVIFMSVSFVVVLLLIHHYSGDKSLSHLITSSACTDADIKEYFKANGGIPTGNWTGNRSLAGRIVRDATFKPNLNCSVHHAASMTGERLRSCLLPKKHNRIMTFGDSNAKKYFDAIYHIVKSSMSCELKRIGHINKTATTREMHYFMKPNVTFPFQVDPVIKCWTCHSELYECRHRGRIIILEHIASVTLVSVEKKEASTNDSTHISFPQFLFKHYLKDNYPDVLFIFPPFNHICRNSHPEFRRKKISGFVELLHRYIPRSSKVYWITTFREVEQRKPKYNAYAKYNGELATEGISKLNQILLEVLKSRLSDPESNDFTMWDMIQASEGMEAWSKDGVHMKPLWYARMAPDFLHVHCNSLQIRMAF